MVRSSFWDRENSDILLYWAIKEREENDEENDKVNKDLQVAILLSLNKQHKKNQERLAKNGS